MTYMKETAKQKHKTWKIKAETVETTQHYPGAQAVQGGVVFSAAFPTDRDVTLLIYHKGDEDPCAEIPMPLSPLQGLWRSVKLSGLTPGQLEYNYLVDGKLRQDPAAALITGRGGFGDPARPEKGQVRCALLTNTFDWKEECGPLQLPYEEVVSYLLHVRGFTKQKGSRVRHPGTFKGLEEKIPYLKELGINQVVLMPAYEFDEIMRPQMETPASSYAEAAASALTEPQAAANNWRLNYWGYGSGWYFAPKASYAAGVRPDLEFKSMVRAMHLAGIEVVMEFAFADGTDVDFMAHCLSWWNREYHVDGFVLMTAPDAAKALASYPALRMTKLINGFFDTDALYPQGRKIRHRMAADLNDGFRNDMRRMLKGDSGMLKAFTDRSRRNERDKAVINQICGHDGFTLMDLVSYGQKYNEANGEGGRDGNADELSWNCGAEGPTRKKSVQKLRMRQMKNAMAMLLLAQGTPLLLAGDEFGNSQSGNNNPWCQDNEISWLDWKGQKQYRELTEFVRMLIAFRKEHSILHRPAPLTGGDQASCGFPDFSCHSESAWYSTYDPENRHIGLMYTGTEDGEPSYIYIGCNFHWEEQELAIPYLPEGYDWYFTLGTGNAEDETPYPEKPVRTFRIAGRTILVLEGRKTVSVADSGEEPEKEEAVPERAEPEKEKEAVPEGAETA